MNIRKIILTCILVVTSAQALPENNARQLHLSDLIGKIIERYPSLEIAAMEIQHARQEFAKVESQLGWILSAHGGVSRDVSFIDSPTDHYEAGLSFRKKMESGSSVELSGLYTHDDSETAFSPAIPDPVERSRIDINFRQPLLQGEGNVDYTSGMLSAQSQLLIQEANQKQIIDNLIQQAMSIYYDASLTFISIEDANSNIDRINRLLKFVENNKRLGLAEKKDILRVKAQLNRQIAYRDSLLVAWNRQKAEINKLIGSHPNHDFLPVIQTKLQYDINDKNKLIAAILSINPLINIQKGKLKAAEAEIARTIDNRKNKLDLVLSLGGRTSSGDTVSGSVNNNETVGGARLEYTYNMDKRGFDAGYYQALIRKEQAEKELMRLRKDLEYKLEGLLSQYYANIKAVESNHAHFRAEKIKIDDAYKRYREGRSATDELIDYENALQASHLAHQNQRISLSRNIADLQLLVGTLWNNEVLEQKVRAIDRERIGE